MAFAEAVLAARPAALQLRAKDLGAAETLALLRAITPLARSAGVPFFANDRPDLALLAGCDGVHVGQEDMPVAEVKRIAPGLMVGVSTHDTSQLDAAIADGPAYVAFGPVYPTASKERPDPVVGLPALRDAAARSPLPVVAIGGIDLACAHAIAEAGAVGAVIGALIPDGSCDYGAITERARALALALGS